jgi:3-hydroxy-9,10-secoandrosta-1,3,5(10)-triene-9,17-dione monooxygenase
MTTYYRLAVEIGHGGSAGIAWCLDLGTHHSIIVASHWPEQAQREIFGADGHFVCGHRAGVGGTARKERDGYRISGRWRYSSGVPYATHHLVGLRIEGGEEEPRVAAACVPRDQFEVLWDWGGGRDLGLQASGSNTVVIEDAWVPEHWVVGPNWRSFDQSNGTPGTRLHGNPMFLGVNGSFYHAALVAPQVGAVRAALDEYEQVLRSTKNRFPPPELQYESRWFQQSYGLALAQCDAAEMILERAGEKYMEYCERWARTGQPFSLEEDARLHASLQQAGKLAWRAMEAIWTGSPADSAKRESRLQRYYRDISMYRLHASSRPLMLTPQIAAVHFGLSDTVMPAGPG